LSAWALLRSFKEDNGGNQFSFVQEAVKKRDSWKEAAIQRGLEHGSLRISIVRSRYRGAAGEDAAGWKNLAGTVVICELWRLAMSL
jgi:hypothetical protein